MENRYEHNIAIICVFLEFKRAFETIDRGLLLTKQHNGFYETAIKSMQNYMADRIQRTEFIGHIPTEKENPTVLDKGFCSLYN